MLVKKFIHDNVLKSSHLLRAAVESNIRRKSVKIYDGRGAGWKIDWEPVPLSNNRSKNRLETCLFKHTARTDSSV